MKWFDSFIQRCVNRAHHRDMNQSIELDDSPKRNRLGRGGLTPVGRRVEHNYNDRSVITFKVFGANGGMIVETNRYDEKMDTEAISRYVISEDADLSDSLGKIVTMEYMR